MRPDRLRFRLSAALAAAAGAAVLFVAARVIQDSTPRQERRAPAHVAVAPAPVVPAPAAAAREAGPAPEATPARGSAGMVVGIDPETGKLGLPSPEFRAQLSRSAALDRSMTGLTVVTRPDGSKHLDLQGRFQEYMLIRLTPDGRKVEACVQGPDVDAALRGDAGVLPAPDSVPASAPASDPAAASPPAHEVR